MRLPYELKICHAVISWHLDILDLLVYVAFICFIDASSQNSCEFGSATYYAYCGFGGMLSCGLTHTAIVPLDLVKCRLQVDGAKYKNLFTGFKVTVAEEGVRGKNVLRISALLPNVNFFIGANEVIPYFLTVKKFAISFHTG